jgi:hypothetical protein
MRKIHSAAALRGDGLRPELKSLFDRMIVDPHTEVFVRADGMVQSGPDPKAKTKPAAGEVAPNVAIVAASERIGSE